MDEASQLVAQFEKNSKEEVRVSLDDFRGRKIINMRVYYRSDNGEWLPGRQGLALGVDRYRDLAEAMLKVGEALQAQGLLPGGGSSVGGKSTKGVR
jgi:Transcriptional Coactivator p15 (PC4)